MPQLGRALYWVFNKERHSFVDRLAAEKLVTVLDLEITEIAPLGARRCALLGHDA